jgi:hypothetical protein
MAYRFRPNRLPRFAAFTLIELLVVVSIIVLLLAILLPSLSRAREQAKQVVCGSNLQGFGRGFYLYAGENRDYFTSGSFDPDRENGRDGPVDKVGWVADLVRFKFAFPGKQLCPSNPAIYNQKLRDDPTMKQRYTAEQALDLIERGFNTNYTQSPELNTTRFVPRSRRIQQISKGVTRPWAHSGPQASHAFHPQLYRYLAMAERLLEKPFSTSDASRP